MGNVPTGKTAIGDKPIANVGLYSFGSILTKLTKQTRSGTA